MFQPTHIAHMNTPTGPRVVALQRTHSLGELEVFRDSAHAEFHQWGEMGIQELGEYQIRAITPGEALCEQHLEPVGPPAVMPYKVRGLASFVSEPSMLTC